MNHKLLERPLEDDTEKKIDAFRHTAWHAYAWLIAGMLTVGIVAEGLRVALWLWGR